MYVFHYYPLAAFKTELFWVIWNSTTLIYMYDYFLQVGCPTTDSLTIIECLRTIDADVLIDTGYTCTVSISLFQNAVIEV